MSSSHPHPTLLFQDADLLVIDKPAGLRAIPDGYDPDLPYLQKMLEPEFGPLWMVHRLDKGTSGVMVLARNAEAHRQLNQAFREHSVHKVYHGLATPTPVWSEQVIDLPLKINADRRHRTRVDSEDGKPAWTHCKVLDKFALGARLEITIKTGLTHQIRAHLRELGFTLLGEDLYATGLPAGPIPAERVMLHARELHFKHPTDAGELHFSAPYPEDFRSAYAHLRRTKGPAEGF